MTDNERKESISVLRQLLAMCDFVDQYGDSIDADPYFDAVETVIESLNETVWIPVSERLPKRGKDVLVTRKYYGKDDCNKDSIYVEISGCYADGEEWYGYSDEYKMSPKNHKVIAWMPLPEPYKGGDTDG